MLLTWKAAPLCQVASLGAWSSWRHTIRARPAPHLTPRRKAEIGTWHWDTEKLKMTNTFHRTGTFNHPKISHLHFSADHHKRPPSSFFTLDLPRQPLSTAAQMLPGWLERALGFGSLRCSWINKPSKPPLPYSVLRNRPSGHSQQVPLPDR